VYNNRVAYLSSNESHQVSPGFVMLPWALCCGIAGHPALHQLWVYQAALNQAREVLRPSLPERDLLAMWN
jgi:hypothetical protein